MNIPCTKNKISTILDLVRGDEKNERKNWCKEDKRENVNEYALADKHGT